MPDYRLIQKNGQQMREVRVVFDDKNMIETNINGTRAEIRHHYQSQPFNFGDTEEHPQDKLQYAQTITFLDEPDTIHIEAKVDLNGFDGFDDYADPNSIPNIKRVMNGMVLHAIRVRDEFLNTHPRIPNAHKLKQLQHEIAVARLIEEKLTAQFTKE